MKIIPSIYLLWRVLDLKKLTDDDPATHPKSAYYCYYRWWNMPLTLTRLFTANPTGRCDPLESKEEPSMASLESIDFHSQYQSLPCNSEAFLLSRIESSEITRLKKQKMYAEFMSEYDMN